MASSTMTILFCFMLFSVREGQGWNLPATYSGGNCLKFTSSNARIINLRKTMPLPRTRLRMSNDDYVISQEIIDAEAKSTPLRPVRYQLYAVVGVLSAIAGISLLVSGDAPPPADGSSFIQSIASSVPVLISKQVTTGLLLAASGGMAAFYALEETTKRDNHRRIAERLAQRRIEVLGPNRSERRARAKQQPVTPPARPAAPPAAAPAAPAAEDPAAARAEGDKAAGSSSGPGGLLGLVKGSDLFKEASELGRAQAIQLNAALEDAGVLPPVAPRPPTTPPTPAGKADPATGGKKGGKGKKSGRR